MVVCYHGGVTTSFERFLLSKRNISTHINNLIRVPLNFFWGTAIGRKVRKIGSARTFEVFVLCLIAITTIAAKGAHGEGQSGFFSHGVRGYIEETSATIAKSVTGDAVHLQYADANSLANLNTLAIGGGAIAPDRSIDLVTIQDNTVVAYTPATEDYLDSVGFRRNGIIDYEVQQGDRLTFIASDFGISIDSIRWANGLKDDTIRPGQELRIPPVSGVIHKVKRGDTMGSVAKKYGADIETILAFNALPQSGTLDVGDEIIVPDGTIKVQASGLSTVVARQFSYLPDLGSYFSLPATGFNWGRIHGRNGVDVANACGTSIQSAAAGKVTVADSEGWNGGFGKFVRVEHDNGTETIYAHASKLLVQVGQSIPQGTAIALMGTTGRSTGCHLHFEVHGARNPLAKY